MFVPPPLPLPAPRATPWRRLAILFAMAATVGGGLYLYHRLSQNKLAKSTTVEPKAAGGPVRPTVETLPTAPGTEPAARNEGADDNRAEPAQPKNQDQGSSAESGSRRRHASSAERRALQREQEEDTALTGRRINPYEDRNTATRKSKELRPNPF